jgi:DNA-binding XRE family transcriptional regulator
MIFLGVRRTIREEQLIQIMSFMRWIDEQLDSDPAFRAKVEEALDELRIEQDLIALRQGRHWSQSQLAKALGVSQPAIAKIESHKVKNLQLKTLIRVVTALGGRVRIDIERDTKGGKIRSYRRTRHVGRQQARTGA